MMAAMLVPAVAAAAASAGAGASAYGGWAMPGGLPAYRYTADQDQLGAAAALPPNAPFGLSSKKDTTARGDREHSAMLGNDRLVLVGSNYGSWRIRQDEGGPKWLTDSDVDNATGWRFGGGVAFVYDAERRTQLATSVYASGDATAREWGVGYGVTTSGGGAFALVKVRHTVAVLPGTQPAALIEVTVQNLDDKKARNVTVAEVWDTSMVLQATGIGWGGWSNYTPAGFPQFSNTTVQAMLDRRKFTAAHYRSSFKRVANRSAGVGAVQTRQFLGLSAAETRFYEQTSKLPKRPSLEDTASMWDKAPPALFLTRTDPAATETNTAFLNSARDFYHGSGSVAAGSASGTSDVGGIARLVRVAPGGGRLASEMHWQETVLEGETALIGVASDVLVPANGSITLKFVIGYLPPGACIRGPDATVALDCASSARQLRPTAGAGENDDENDDENDENPFATSVARQLHGSKLQI